MHQQSVARSLQIAHEDIYSSIESRAKISIRRVGRSYIAGLTEEPRFTVCILIGGAISVHVACVIVG